MNVIVRKSFENLNESHLITPEHINIISKQTPCTLAKAKMQGEIL
jgi:hypothetical protein